MTISLEKKLGYIFNQQDLLQRALAHRSYGKKNNERLEFLGDSILNFIIAETLYERYPEAPEGDLSRLRAMLVKGDTLSEVAKELDIGPHLLLGPGEMKTGGHQRTSILADTVEAIIAAIYLDTGLEAARDRILNWFSVELAGISPDTIVKDPKSRLQEFLQARQLSLPEYELIDTIGKEHAQTFVVSCKVDLLEAPVEGRSSSRRKAEQSAAENVLAKLESDDD